MNRGTSASILAPLACVLLILAASPALADRKRPTEHWVSTWASAQQLAPLVNPWVPPPGADAPGADEHSPILPSPERLENQTVRMLVRTSVGGRRMRVQLSNALGNASVTIGSTHVAVQSQGSGIRAGTDRAVTFGGRAELRIPAGAIIVSDPIDLAVQPLTMLAVSLYIPGEVAQLTKHPLGLHTTYIASGDLSGAASLPSASECNSYFWLAGIEVIAPARTQTIVAFGDSITDGYATTPNADRAWPSKLFERSRALHTAAASAIVNVGFSGNRVLHDDLGTSALARFDRDVLSRPGVRWIIFLEGINDISFPASPGEPEGDHIIAEDLIAGYREFIDKAHLHGISVLGATLLPWEGDWTFTPRGEVIRQQVNQWIRTSREFDRIVDFDAVARDPAHPTRLKPEFDSGDHIHPNDAGNQAMADAIDLSTFQQ
jgi:lysophospholipase L1-like esterase